MSGSDRPRTAVTGATGFVGRVLSRQLQARRHRVLALIRRQIRGPWETAIPCVLGDEPVSSHALQGIDTVFHLAGIAHTRGVEEGRYRQVNVEGTRALLRAAIEAGVQRFVFVSSVKAVADPAGDACVDEDWAHWPEDAYGRSKREAETLVLEEAARAGVHAAVIRPTLVYGPGVKGNLERIMRLVASGWCPPLPETGNRRSMVHVEDLCMLLMLAARDGRANGRVYIAADDHPVSTRALYEGLLHTMGRRVPGWTVPPAVMRVAGRMGDGASGILNRPLPIGSETVSRLLDSACYSGQKAMDELGWRPRHDLLSSLPEMVEAWQNAPEKSG